MKCTTEYRERKNHKYDNKKERVIKIEVLEPVQNKR